MTLSKGVLIFKGMKIGILPGDLTISFDPTGKTESKAVLSTAYNVVPIWLRIAHDNVVKSKAAANRIIHEWSSDGNHNRQLLVDELEHCLQVFVACGVALDALYDQLRPFAGLTKSDIDSWRKNKTGRAKQISEVIRRIFKLDGPPLKWFKQNLFEILKYRDLAVHPSIELKQSCSRPDIPVGVDWKFALYRYENSQNCFTSTMGMLSYLYENPCPNEDVTASIHSTVMALEELGVVAIKKQAPGST